MSTEKRRRIDVEAQAALAALYRARKRAERVARMTGTCLVQAVDGRPVRVPPPPETTPGSEETTPPAEQTAAIMEQHSGGDKVKPF